MSDPIQCCPHPNANGCEAFCDCGRKVWACYGCLAAGKVLSCGQCGITEATQDGDGTLVLARKCAALEIQTAVLGGEIHDKNAMKRYLQNEVDELKREDDKDDYWKH